MPLVIGTIVRGFDIGKANNNRYEFVRCVECGGTRWITYYSNSGKRWPSGRMCKQCSGKRIYAARVAAGYSLSADARRRIAYARSYKLDEGVLLALYLGDELSCPEVGKLLGCSHSTVWRRLRALGIPIRGAGMYTKRLFSGKKCSVEVRASMRRGWSRKLASVDGDVWRAENALRTRAYWDGLPDHKKEQRRIHLRRIASDWLAADGKVDRYLDRNPNWQGGKSFEPYSPDFNETTRERIRDRDGRKCQVCLVSENGRRHDVHHIDFNKKHSHDGNMITLCVPHHAMTFGRSRFSSVNEGFQVLLRGLLSSRGIFDTCSVEVH